MKYNIENLKDIYIVSNTANYLYNNFIKDSSLIDVVKHIRTKELIDSFINLAANEIKVLDDLVLAYALYITILMKNDKDSLDFIHNEGKISFEWFEEIRNIFLSKMKNVEYFNFSQYDFNNYQNNNYSENSDYYKEVIQL